MYGSGLYTTVPVLLSFNCSSLACGSFGLQICLSTTGVVTSSCGPVATHRRTGKSAGVLSSEELSMTLHLRARCGPLYHRVSSFVSLPLCLNFEHFMICIL
jgi:hypothetical protein